MTFAPITDPLASALNPEWDKMKAKIEKVGKGVHMAGVASIVSAVVLFILGIIICATANPAGIAPILISLPLFYTGYNALVFGKNLSTLAKNPKEFCEYEGLGSFDDQKIKKHLLNKTFGLSPLYDCVTKKIGFPNKPASESAGL